MPETDIKYTELINLLEEISGIGIRTADCFFFFFAIIYSEKWL